LNIKKKLNDGRITWGFTLSHNLKPKKCKQCGLTFKPSKPLQIVCNYKCGIAYINSKKDKQEANLKRIERKKTKEAKERIKTRQEWLREAQQWFNKYVRMRDEHLGCVSCDKPASWHGQWHASHFRSTKAASAVRFNLWNVHKSCSVCNNWLSGNLSEYEPKLRERIGNEKVDWLRQQNQTVTYSIDYLKRLKGIFKKKCARLSKKLTKDNL